MEVLLSSRWGARMRRRYLLFGIDLFWVALSPFVALFIRENFAPYTETLSGALTYALVGVILAALVLPLAGLNRGLWRYTSLPDLLRLVMAVTTIMLLSLFTTFAFSRLEGIARSLPVIQWFVLIGCMGGSRLAIRMWHERCRGSAKEFRGAGETQNVLLLGVNQLAELYLRSVAEFAPQKVSVVGFLASGVELQGRLLRSHKVLGHPDDLPQVARQLEVHGAPLDRIIVVEPPARLSRGTLEALLELERSSTIKVDWLPELLGFGSRESQPGDASAPVEADAFDAFSHTTLGMSIGRYARLKRLLDLLGAACLVVFFAPVTALVGVLTVFDVGLPVVFWQKRPGRYGHSFKLYKFCTMRGAHDQQGNRIADQQRLTKLGTWLRRTRLDELPQLYNILVGEMSFVGPRPLLPSDQPNDMSLRLCVRPGLTGLAQVHGERTMSAEDKNALDIWYIQNASLLLDIKILFRTVIVFARGERVDRYILEVAREGFKRLRSQNAAVGAPTPSRVGKGQLETVPSLG